MPRRKMSEIAESEQDWERRARRCCVQMFERAEKYEIEKSRLNKELNKFVPLFWNFYWSKK